MTATETITIKPALTDDQWRAVLARKDEWPATSDEAAGLHAAAAVGLHEQPFGFGWPDHDMLIDEALSIEQAWTPPPLVYLHPADLAVFHEARLHQLAKAAKYRDLAGRIAALLAPR